MQSIKSVTFIGDCHFQHNTPKSRVDDYADTSIEKLRNLLEICRLKDYRHVVFLGDFSHTPNQPLEYVNKLVSVFQDFKKYGITTYSILGNHDLTRSDIDNANKSLLWLMFQTNLIKELRTEIFMTSAGYDVGLYGFHYPEAIKPIFSQDIKGTVNLCAMHRYIDYSLSKTSLTSTQVGGLGYNIVASGHLHNPFEVTKYDDFTLIRPGRFMRGTGDKHNLEDPNVYIDTVFFEGTKEAPKTTFIRDIVKTKKASEVFSILALNKDRESARIAKTLSEKVSVLLDMMDTTQSGTNTIYQVLDKLQVDDKIKSRVETYLHKEGIYRTEE